MNNTTSIGWASTQSFYQLAQRDDEWRLLVDWAVWDDRTEDRRRLLLRRAPRLLTDEEKRLSRLTDEEVAAELGAFDKADAKMGEHVKRLCLDQKPPWC